MLDLDIGMPQTNGTPSRAPVAEDIAVPEPSPKEIQNALYARCASQPADKIFDQHYLLALGVIPNDDLGRLLLCTKQLSKDGLFKVMTRGGVACWRVVKREEAARSVPVVSIHSAQRVHYRP